MNLAEVTTMLDYHYWARDRVLAAAEALTPEQYTRRGDSSFPSVRDTLVHIYSADWVWQRRWEGESPTTMIDPAGYPDVASLRRAWGDLERAVRALVTGLGEAGIQQTVSYRNLAGQGSTQPFWQLVQHLVNHGSYHRGQATTQIRQAGGAPPKAMDLVAFYRERSAGA